MGGKLWQFVYSTLKDFFQQNGRHHNFVRIILQIWHHNIDKIIGSLGKDTARNSSRSTRCFRRSLSNYSHCMVMGKRDSTRESQCWGRLTPWKACDRMWWCIFIAVVTTNVCRKHGENLQADSRWSFCVFCWVHKILRDTLDKTKTSKRFARWVPHLLIQDDSAPVHAANMVAKLLRSYNWENLNHPRYSPDLAPCDF